MHALIGWLFLFWRSGDCYARSPREYIGVLKEVVQKKWYIIQTCPKLLIRKYDATQPIYHWFKNQ